MLTMDERLLNARNARYEQLDRELPRSGNPLASAFAIVCIGVLTASVVLIAIPALIALVGFIF
jgi:hypothetical protein